MVTLCGTYHLSELADAMMSVILSFLENTSYVVSTVHCLPKLLFGYKTKRHKIRKLRATTWSFVLLNAGENIIQCPLHRFRCRGIEVARTIFIHSIPFDDSRGFMDRDCGLHSY